jgi:hypothetical protein
VLQLINVEVQSKPQPPVAAVSEVAESSQPAEQPEETEKLQDYLKSLPAVQLALLPNPVVENYMTLPEINDFRAGCLAVSSKEELEKWSKTF